MSMMLLGQFCAPVRIHTTAPERDLTARFMLLPPDHATSRFSGLPGDDAARIETLRACWIGWLDIVDEAGRKVPFSAEARERLLSDTRPTTGRPRRPLQKKP
jgi:hypothetical protein